MSNQVTSRRSKAIDVFINVTSGLGVVFFGIAIYVAWKLGTYDMRAFPYVFVALLLMVPGIVYRLINSARRAIRAEALRKNPPQPS